MLDWNVKSKITAENVPLIEWNLVYLTGEKKDANWKSIIIIYNKSSQSSHAKKAILKKKTTGAHNRITDLIYTYMLKQLLEYYAWGEMLYHENYWIWWERK